MHRTYLTLRYLGHAPSFKPRSLRFGSLLWVIVVLHSIEAYNVLEIALNEVT